MCLVHHAADGVVVAGVEGVADGEHALFLADDEAGAAVVLVRDVAADGVEHRHVGVAQGVDAQAACHALAALAPFVVGAVDQLVLDVAVDEHQGVVFGRKGEIFKLHRAAVEAHEVALFAHH